MGLHALPVDLDLARPAGLLGLRSGPVQARDVEPDVQAGAVARVVAQARARRDRDGAARLAQLQHAGGCATTGRGHSRFTGPGTATYAILDAAADYGSIPAGGSLDLPAATGNCYALSISNPPARPVPALGRHASASNCRARA